MRPASLLVHRPEGDNFSFVASEIRNRSRWLRSETSGFKSGLPFVVKIHKEARIKMEHEATKNVSHCFRDAHLVAGPTYQDGKGALLYWHQGAPTAHRAQESKELREIVQKRKMWVLCIEESVKPR